MPGASVIGLEVAGYDREYEWDRVAGDSGYTRHTVFSERNYHDLSRAEIMKGVQSALTIVRPDVVAINGWSVPEAQAAVSWARSRGVFTILMSETKSDDRRRSWWKEAAKRAIIRRFDAALVGGGPHADYLAHLGFPPERIRFGYNAVDNNYFEKQSDAARRRAVELRSALRLPNEFFFVCTRFLPRKNLDGLLRAYAAYRRTGFLAWDLVIAGSGSEEQELRHLAETLGIADAVHWAGFVQYPDLPTYFGLASAFVHVAKHEAWGLVVNEAAASALPLIVARTAGAASQLVRDGETGLLVDGDNDADIARAFTDMTGMSESERVRMASNARALVSQWGPNRFGSELAASINSVQHRRAVRVVRP
jgi:1,2-diacylglycerol 3-alpha-glucosyltransferase